MSDRIKCTYNDCDRYFNTVVDMKKHKHRDRDHDYYCKKCDMDCLDDYDLLYHQITGDLHIACPMCGKEFKTEAGRALHVRRDHPPRQKVDCRGCGRTFDRASNVMAHIEGGDCPIIRPAEFQQQRAEQQILSDVWAVAEDPTVGTTVISNATVLSPVQNENNLLDNEQAYIDTDWQGVRRPEVPNQQDVPHTALSALSISSFPTLDPQTRAPVSRTTNEPNSPLSTPASSRLNQRPHHQLQGAWSPTSTATSTTLFPRSLTPLPNTNTNTQSHTSTSTPTFPLAYIHNPISNLYICPSALCNQSFPTQSAFNDHLLRPPHTNATQPCPGCYKRFRTTTALMAHIESGSVRCRVREAYDADGVVRGVSAGLVGVQGVNEEGGVRFVGGEN